MVSWEDAFTRQHKKGTVVPQPKTDVRPDHPDLQRKPVPGTAGSKPERKIADTTLQAPMGHKAARKRHKTLRKKTTATFPPTLNRLHNFLDDIWVNILLEAEESPPTLLFCGASPGEGSMFLAFQMALFLALGHHLKTLYVDTNVNAFKQNPFIPHSGKNTGLASFFMDQKPLKSLVSATEYDNFFVMPSGSDQVKDKRKNVIIETEDLQELMTFCRDNYDIAIFSGQPLLARPIMLKFAQLIDHVVMVCRYGFSRREVSRLAIDRLRENDVSLLGIILNDRQYPVPRWVYRILK